MYPQNDNGSYRPCGRYDPRVREWFMTITEEKQKIVVLVDTSCSMLNNSASSLIADLIKKLHDFATFDPNGIKFKTLSNFNQTFTGAFLNWFFELLMNCSLLSIAHLSALLLVRSETLNKSLNQDMKT